jgi:hypothetical protein
MPCYDPRDDIEREERRRKEMPCNMMNDSNPEDWKRGGDLSIKHNADAIRRELEETEAMLCMIMRRMLADGTQVVLEDKDFEEAGLTRGAFDAWWSRHEYKDTARRKKEAVERETKKQVNEILSKLTPEERTLLGYPKT